MSRRAHGLCLLLFGVAATVSQLNLVKLPAFFLNLIHKLFLHFFHIALPPRMTKKHYLIPTKLDMVPDSGRSCNNSKKKGQTEQLSK